MYGGIQTVRISIILYFIDPLAYPVWKRKIETVIITWEKNYKCLVFMHNLRYNSDINSTFFLKCIKCNSATYIHLSSILLLLQNLIPHWSKNAGFFIITC